MDGSLTIDISPVDLAAGQTATAEPTVIAPALSYFSDGQLAGAEFSYKMVYKFCGEIENEIRWRLDVENPDWVECSVETEPSGDVLMVRGYDLRHPGCLTEKLVPGAACIYTSGHHQRVWAKAPIAAPSDGNEPNEDFVTGGVDNIVETALDTAYYHESEMVAGARRYYDAAVRPKISEKVHAWWSAVKGQELSRETVLAIGEYLMELCRFEGHVDDPPAFDGFPYIEYPDFYEVAAMIDWRRGDDFFSIEFLYYDKYGEWTEIDSVTVDWE